MERFDVALVRLVYDRPHHGWCGLEILHGHECPLHAALRLHGRCHSLVSQQHFFHTVPCLALRIVDEQVYVDPDDVEDPDETRGEDASWLSKKLTRFGQRVKRAKARQERRNSLASRCHRADM